LLGGITLARILSSTRSHSRGRQILGVGPEFRDLYIYHMLQLVGLMLLFPSAKVVLAVLKAPVVWLDQRKLGELEFDETSGLPSGGAAGGVAAPFLRLDVEKSRYESPGHAE
jgi:hypothetical protein